MASSLSANKLFLNIIFCAGLAAAWGIPGEARAAKPTVKATALEAGCKASSIDTVREETGPAPQNVYKVTCQSDDGKPHSVLVECTLDDCSVLQ